MKITVIHGPNLNMLGKREPDKYGTTSLDAINQMLASAAQEKGVELETFQSNIEGEIVGRIQVAVRSTTDVCDGMIINPAAYTHTSIAIRDALLLLDCPIIEVHISNIFKREPFRHRSMTADIATGQISGLGAYGYILALDALVRMIEK
ncbi:MAG: type II 3-dehydroquinate dehydratase [Deltaproteobacteria bacterium]|nr:type II 3-dehydroquinate dehydratase [Deltaproteobacteria bacterium]